MCNLYLEDLELCSRPRLVLPSVSVKKKTHFLSFEAPVFYPHPKLRLEATQDQQTTATTPVVFEKPSARKHAQRTRKGEAQEILIIIGMRGTRT